MTDNTLFAMVEALVKGKVAPTTSILTLANGANSDIALPATELVRIVGPTGSFSISGFVAGTDGRKLRCYSTVSQTCTLTNNATSTAANRILTLKGSDLALRTTAPAFFTLSYSTADSRWILESTNGGAV